MALFCNSIPKSGTYLLSSLAEFCNFNYDFKSFLDHGTLNVDSNMVLQKYEPSHAPERLLSLQEGSFAPCHLTYTKELNDFLAQQNSKMLFIYRHPFSIIYSYVRFVTYSENFRNHSKDQRDSQDRLLNNFGSDEERFCHVAHNLEGEFNFEKNSPWLESSSCLPIRFETLYQELIELQDGNIGPLLKSIFNYIEYDGFTSLTTNEIFKGIYGQGPTYSTFKNKIDGYKSLDQSQITQITHSSTYKHFLKLYGYATEA